jgi:hypothetical protein
MITQVTKAVSHQDDEAWAAAGRVCGLAYTHRALQAWREYVTSIVRPKVCHISISDKQMYTQANSAEGARERHKI